MSDVWKEGENGGRIVLVTGGARGIGREIARRLSRTAAGVAVHYRRSAGEAAAAAAELRSGGTRCEVFPADLTDESAAAEMIKGVEKSFGRIDILINNVGPLRVKPWGSLESADWEEMWRSNLMSAWFCLRAALPGMRSRGWGRIVNLGYSRAERVGAFSTILPYACAKTSLLILTRSAARAEGRHGITVNMVSPGLIEGGVLPVDQKVPAGRLGAFEDVADAVAFLVSSDAGYISGENLVVAGGWKL